MCDQALGEDEICDSRKKKYHSVCRDWEWRIVVLSHPCGSERYQGKTKQEDEIGPENSSRHAFRRVQEVMMIVPIDSQVQITQNVRQKNGNNGFKGVQVRSLRYFHIEHHNGYDHGEDAVAERFQSAFGHREFPPFLRL